MTDEEWLAFKREFDELVQLRLNMKSCHDRCNELIDENRVLKQQNRSLVDALQKLGRAKHG